ncbi:MAG: hypothetical protein J6X58_06600 [Bacteroidales bacterium]|nr:hypothetical protein [Bacteroidales bacterium]
MWTFIERETRGRFYEAPSDVVECVGELQAMPHRPAYAAEDIAIHAVVSLLSHVVRGDLLDVE